MARFFTLARALGLVAVLLFGQQLVALHDLAHASEQLSRQDGKPGSSTCDLCFSCAQLSGAVGVSPPALPPDPTCRAAPSALLAEDTAPTPFLAFRSRAPPTIL